LGGNSDASRPLRGTLNPLLSPQQRAVIGHALSGKSFFFTGMLFIFFSHFSFFLVPFS
jgi:hypothetical protein